jgi:hypothetical protein
MVEALLTILDWLGERRRRSPLTPGDRQGQQRSKDEGSGSR